MKPSATRITAAVLMPAAAVETPAWGRSAGVDHEPAPDRQGWVLFAATSPNHVLINHRTGDRYCFRFTSAFALP
jgi:hypothetical protein